MLVSSKETDELWALKTVHKLRMVQSEKVHTILAERNILRRCAHPFVVNLRFAFQSATKFYLGLEYIPGGDLCTLLHRQGVIPLSQVRLYVAELCLAIDHLHTVGIVYRDIKPENILINTDGHLKLTDFGLAKDLSRLRVTSSFCGTADYMAPEMVEKQEYSFSVDWWGIGILTFNLLYGNPPFHDDNKAKLYANISLREPVFPDGTEPDVIDFVKKLLAKNPKHRANFQSLKEHSFWNGLNFDDVLAKRVRPEYIPMLADRQSTENFESIFTNETAVDSIATPALGDEHVFANFSFVVDRNLSPSDFDSPARELKPTQLV
jgi:serine/threonine protein kinase